MDIYSPQNSKNAWENTLSILPSPFEILTRFPFLKTLSQMSPFIILSVISLLYICSRPKFRRFVERDGIYLSRSWTCFVNAIFISLVVCSHGLNLFQTTIRDYLPEKLAAATISQFGQLMVATFFFYSGYGIMYSLLTRWGGILIG